MDKALESFNLLKTMLCSEPVMAYPRSDQTHALKVSASTGTDTVEVGMVPILTKSTRMNNSMLSVMYQNNSSIKELLFEMSAVV